MADHIMTRTPKDLARSRVKAIDTEGSAAGVLHQYANASLIGLEKEAWRKAAVEKHVEAWR